MKKRLEADLVSIAHRILQLKNKSDVNVLFLETQKLYEKLAILKFVEENLGDIKPTIGQAAIEAEIEKAFDLPEIKTEIPTTEAVIETEVQKQEPIIETVSIVDQLLDTIAPEDSILKAITSETATNEIEEKTPISFAPSSDESEVINETATQPNIPIEEKKNEAVQISFEELLGGNYSEAQFVKVDSTETTKTNSTSVFDLSFDKVETLTEEKEDKPKSLNEKLSKGINIDLNDRIGFVKHLFGNSNEDYNRVLSQLNSFNNFYETKTFIDEMVKPDYNNWEGKDDYANRFMEIVEKKFL
ncbi:hypothetical protein [Flavobacterium sp.]|jgi:hypothetical protein|uniref:hypothetical protein n=1 Tax=Flavobacterium sp. TaxID=239 RepID=UPI0022BE049C|nr:hypothetical protein [Flavobacterium sp.]MCZ8229008.1 hypothetical protein [Flavobacterium sp.]